MEMKSKFFFVSLFFLLTSCASTQKIHDVYVEDFYIEDSNICKSSDVDLDNHEAEIFFLKSRRVDHKIIHHHYNVAPCYIEGLLTLNTQVCRWKIQASSIGSIECDDEVVYYVCDTCQKLFE